MLVKYGWQLSLASSLALLAGTGMPAWSQAGMAQAQAAQAELAQVRTWTSAQLAAVVGAGGELLFLKVLDSFCCCSHVAFSS